MLINIFDIFVVTCRNQSLVDDMIFHAPFLILSLRCIVPSVVIMGSATSLWILTTAAKLLSLPFGRSAYHRLDQRVTSSIVSLIGYFFETWSGVEVDFFLLIHMTIIYCSIIFTGILCPKNQRVCCI